MFDFCPDANIAVRSARAGIRVTSSIRLRDPETSTDPGCSSAEISTHGVRDCFCLADTTARCLGARKSLLYRCKSTILPFATE